MLDCIGCTSYQHYFTSCLDRPSTSDGQALVPLRDRIFPTGGSLVYLTHGSSKPLLGLRDSSVHHLRDRQSPRWTYQSQGVGRTHLRHWELSDLIQALQPRKQNCLILNNTFAKNAATCNSPKAVDGLLGEVVLRSFLEEILNLFKIRSI